MHGMNNIKAMWRLSVLRHCVGIIGMAVDTLNLTISEFLLHFCLLLQFMHLTDHL